MPPSLPTRRAPILVWVVVFLLVLAAVAGVAWTFLRDNADVVSQAVDGEAQPRLPIGMLSVNGESFVVELARSEDEQRRGLSFRPPLAPDEGMLFVYDVAQPQRFWMFGMTFPLDIIFIRDTLVVHVEQNVPPPSGITPPAVISSPTFADMVLELPAGTAARIGIIAGTDVSVSLPAP